MMLRACCLLLGLWCVHEAWGQVPVAEDSLQFYELEEIVVQSGLQRAVTAATVQRVDLAAITQRDAATVSDVARLIPAAHVQTNSRGETLVYLRSAGERQVALFFDGALLNVPWDNRFDLSLVPAGVIGGMTVAKGVPSVLYGTNVLGGAVNLTSRHLETPGRFTEAVGMVGVPEQVRSRLTHLGRTPRWRYSLSAGYDERNGVALPGDAGLGFSQPDDELRTNTDQRLVNLFGQASYQLDGGAQVGVSLLHLDGEKGIAPEGHLDPEEARVRFWRYPVWRTSMLVLNGMTPLGEQGALLRGAAWGSRFTQAIKQFQNVAYDQLLADQEDHDLTAGTRLIVHQPVGPGEARFAVNVLTSQHRQQDRNFGEEGRLLPPILPEQTYRQHLWSLGTEYEWEAADRWTVLAGASLDGQATPETGDKPPQDPLVDYGVAAGVRYDLDEAWSVRASAGRKVRFPTMRELFGEALGRFLINPDLQAESSLLTEAGVVLRSGSLSGEAMAFFNRTFGTIDQRSVQVPGEDRPRRQRVNLDGSRVFGVEIVGAARPGPGWNVEGHVAWTDARGFEADGSTRRLAEKPEWLGMLTVVKNLPGGLSFLLQSELIAAAFSPDENNVFQKLPTAWVFNGRVGYRVIRTQAPGFAAQLFGRVDNVTDAVVLPQLGLPGPGRSVRAGIDLSF